MAGRPNKSGKKNQSNSGSISNNYETNTKTEDLAVAEAMLMVPTQETSFTEEEAKEAVVYDSNFTSIDFMLPEEERAILEKNLNNYSDMEKMQKVLTMAKKNKVMKEEVESLNQIEKADKLINNIFDIMNDERNLEMIGKYVRQKLEAGQDPAKVYKEIGLMNKAMMDAREGLINKMKAGKSGKKAKIALKFTNGDGEESQIGVELNG